VVDGGFIDPVDERVSFTVEVVKGCDLSLRKSQMGDQEEGGEDFWQRS
jgi:hypothetical protein